MSYSLVIFDLDGTLADSFPWFRRNVNTVAARYRFRPVVDEDVERLRHASTAEVLDHLGVSRWKLPLIARHIRRLKTEQAASIPLFAGVEAMLAALADAGLRLALVSSDTEANARQKLGASAALFTAFDCSAALYGKARKFRRVVKRTGVAPAEVIAIGDETRDIEAARAAGIAFGAVTWGYAAEKALRDRQPDLVFTRMEEIVERLVAKAAS
ncbi:HAD-IA family hydrolase [Bradyrhizobium sp. SRS-191]|uniref:HAD-IA family hydrolase n=1 Tax=Bradyrhizobium sp. SRS-191 TaxID=2962606 RepID=UPI00211F1FE6|nr:HAD-IA family hydrolase [Bradyrhizobium sp. SRS-191]